MTNIRRYHIPNATVFMTAVCAHREKCLEADWSKELLVSVLSEVTAEADVSIIGYVILDDHFHWMVDLDYIHYNPVKHGYAANPVDYPWSSFGMYREMGVYQSDWGSNGGLLHLAGVNLE